MLREDPLTGAGGDGSSLVIVVEVVADLLDQVAGGVEGDVATASLIRIFE